MTSSEPQEPPPARNGSPIQQADHDESCLDYVNGTVAEESGILNVSLDTASEEVAFDYDPAQISERDLIRVARKMAPTLHQRWNTCTLRLGRRGGRACESCALALESRVQEMDGVRRATASYMGGVLSVTYDDAVVSQVELVDQVRQLGVAVTQSGAEILPQKALPESGRSSWERARAWLTADRLEAIFVVITLLAMVVGLVTERLLEMPTLSLAAYTVAYLAGGVFGLRAGLESLRHLAIDVDLLMILAAIGAAIVGAPFEGAMLLFLFSLSNVLQNYALDRTRNAIRALMRLRPEEALVRRGEQTAVLPISQIAVDDHIIVRPGERIALDGVIVEGQSSIDQSSLTGESLPVGKKEGDTVFAGTINQQGSLEVRVTRLAKDSTIARLIQLVEEAHSEKAQTQRFIDRAEQYYAMGVIIMTILAIVIPIFLLNEAFQPAFYRAMTLMVAASPCALVISTPATVLSAIGNGARKGVLFKGGAYVEQAATIKVIAFDKTGTLTEGRPEVVTIRPLPEFWPPAADFAVNEESLLALAAAAEARSEHPLAQAVVKQARARGLVLAPAGAFRATAGMGVQATLTAKDNGAPLPAEEVTIAVGSARLLAGMPAVGLAEAEAQVQGLQDEGQTAVIVAWLTPEGPAHVLGILGIADVLRPDAQAMIRQLKLLGVDHVAMLTGDNERVARAIGREVGVDGYYADLLPEDKLKLLRELAAQYGPVAMVGDGVNDAPALAAADIGIAMGAAGTDVALETADIVLMADDLSNIPYLLALSRQTRKTLVQNLAFALGMIGVLIAAVLGFNLPLPLSVVGHEGSTVLVSLNGLRMLAFKKE